MKNRILIVDDTDLVKKVVKRSIQGLDVELLEASDGKEGLDVLEKEKGAVDVILLDWNMPRMNGYELLKAVKSNNSLKHIPVIMLTTESEKANINKALQEGAASYILKPFTKDDILDNLSKVLKDV